MHCFSVHSQIVIDCMFLGTVVFGVAQKKKKGGGCLFCVYMLVCQV